jgi:hypothetical protein
MRIARAAAMAVTVLLVSSCSKIEHMANGGGVQVDTSSEHGGGHGGSAPPRHAKGPPLTPYRCDDTERLLSMCGERPAPTPHTNASTWFNDRPDFGTPRSHRTR